MKGRPLVRGELRRSRCSPPTTPRAGRKSGCTHDQPARRRGAFRASATASSPYMMPSKRPSSSVASASKRRSTASNRPSISARSASKRASTVAKPSRFGLLGLLGSADQGVEAAVDALELGAQFVVGQHSRSSRLWAVSRRPTPGSASPTGRRSLLGDLGAALGRQAGAGCGSTSPPWAGSSSSHP